MFENSSWGGQNIVECLTLLTPGIFGCEIPQIVQKILIHSVSGYQERYFTADIASKFNWLYISCICKIAYDKHDDGCVRDCCSNFKIVHACNLVKSSLLNHAIVAETLDDTALSSNRYTLERQNE
ncbi:hypothetical protein RF11_09412 [Thelohanellus kitauei]|uniref:Uncharacterized protein n=1 Tax=Thelohanellus kitauei TaxID=669202 RepID=A0A0C2NGA0_THEKT|nr:hypothetical protein RF11_09412 [Thelohanellus kitauei]